jgi:glycosyltransferase involved in cell wall biosynthesis
VIPHGLDLARYKPIDKHLARQLLNLPLDRKLVLFGTSPGVTGDSRKGLHLLQPALKILTQSDWTDQVDLVVFGGSRPEKPVDLGFCIHYLGQFHDDLSLALVYSAADVMVVPSLQEAFGQTASESLACGTPVVAFRATGLKDIITHQETGYLAHPFEVEDLAQGIAWVLEDTARCTRLSDNARKFAEQELTLSCQAQRYYSLYRDLL